MTLPAPTYDLVLMLDPQAEESARAKIVSDAVTAIEAQGEMVHQDDWGERALTYPIEHRTSAQYHLLQFHVGQKALLEGLDRTLRITDGVLRHRIIKLKPGTPEAPNVGSAPPPRQADAGEPAPRAATEDAPAESPAAETPAAETAAVEAPPAETAALETPAAETVAVETPAAEAPAEAAPAEDAS
jgi:small subunit ribosomal protein S6